MKERGLQTTDTMVKAIGTLWVMGAAVAAAAGDAGSPSLQEEVRSAFLGSS